MVKRLVFLLVVLAFSFALPMKAAKWSCLYEGRDADGTTYWQCTGDSGWYWVVCGPGGGSCQYYQ